MSFRDARARVDSGFYKQKEKSGFETGFAGAADIIASSWIKTAADEKEEAKLKAKQDKAARAATLAAQRKADAKQKKENQAVNSIIRRQGLDPSKLTTEFRGQVLEDVQLMGVGDAIGFYADNKVNLLYAYGSSSEPVSAADPIVSTEAEEKYVPPGVGSMDAAAGQTSTPTLDGIGGLDAAEASVETQTDSMLAENEADAPVISSTATGEISVDETSVKAEENKPVPMFQVEEPKINFKDLTTPALAEQEALRVEDDFPELAANIRKFGEGLFKPLLVSDVEGMGEAARKAALADPNYRTENKAVIERWMTENDSIKLRDAAIIDYPSLTLDNYIQIAEGFRNNTQLENGEELAKKVEAVGQLIKDANNKPLTLTQVDALDLDILEGAVAAGEVEDEDQKELFNKVIERKYNALGRALSGKGDDELAGVINNPFSTEAEISAATAILAGKKDDFDIKDWDTVKGPTLDVAIGVATGEMKTQLEALKKARTNIPSEIKLDMSAGFLMTTYTIDNVTYVATAAPTENGQLYDVDRQKIIPADASPKSTSIKTLGAQASLVSQMNDKILIPLTESRREMAYMLQSAQRLEKFVDPAQGGKPEILTTVGGDVSRLISRLDNEYTALNKMFLGGASEAEVFAYIDNVSELGDTASISSQFQAEVLKFAYLYATVSLEQRGAGLSNTDFANALNIVRAGSDYPTFSGNLRARSKEGIGKVEGRISDIISTSAQIKLLDKLDPSRELSSGYKTTAKDYLTERGLGDMYTYANSELPTSVKEKDPNSTTTAPKKTVGQVVTEYKASATFIQDRDRYKKLLPAQQQTWAELMAAQNGIPVELIIKSYGEVK